MLRSFDDSLRGRITQAVEQPFNVLSKEARSLLIRLHGEVFSSDLCRKCENEQLYAYIVFTRLIENNFIMAESATPPATHYRFNPEYPRKKVVISSQGWVITPETLTDDQAVFMSRLDQHKDIIMTKKEFDKKHGKKATAKK